MVQVGELTPGDAASGKRRQIPSRLSSAGKGRQVLQCYIYPAVERQLHNGPVVTVEAELGVADDAGSFHGGADVVTQDLDLLF